MFPLNNSVIQRTAAERPGPTAGRNSFVYTGEVTNVAWGDAPNLQSKSYTITAEVTVPQGGTEGVILTQGGRMGGYGFYLLKSKPTFLWNLLDVERVRWDSSKDLPPGKHTLVFDFAYDGGGFGKGGTGILRVDGKEVAKKRMEKTIPFLLEWDEAFNIGSDTGTPVDDRDYQVPFRFGGKIDKVSIELRPVPLNVGQAKQIDKVQRAASD